MSTGYLSPIQFQTFLDAQGEVLSGGYIYTYAAGTTTPIETYADNALTTANTNPLVLDSTGHLQTQVWCPEGQVTKYVITDSNGDRIGLTQDNIPNLNDVEPEVPSEWQPGTTPTYVSTTSFSVAGNQQTTYQVGRRVQMVSVDYTCYGTITAVAYTTVTTVTVLIDNAALALDETLYAVYYGILSVTYPSLPMGPAALPGFAKYKPYSNLVISGGDVYTLATNTTLSTYTLTGPSGASAVQFQLVLGVLGDTGVGLKAVTVDQVFGTNTINIAQIEAQQTSTAQSEEYIISIRQTVNVLIQNGVAVFITEMSNIYCFAYGYILGYDDYPY